MAACVSIRIMNGQDTDISRDSRDEKDAAEQTPTDTTGRWLGAGYMGVPMYNVISFMGEWERPEKQYRMSWGEVGHKPKGERYGTADDAVSWAGLLKVGGFELRPDLGFGENEATELSSEEHHALSAWLGGGI